MAKYSPNDAAELTVHAGGGRWRSDDRQARLHGALCVGAGGQQRAAARPAEARRKGARLTRTGKGSVCGFRTPSEPENDSKIDL